MFQIHQSLLLYMPVIYRNHIGFGLLNSKFSHKSRRFAVYPVQLAIAAESAALTSALQYTPIWEIPVKSAPQLLLSAWIIFLFQTSALFERKRTYGTAVPDGIHHCHNLFGFLLIHHQPVCFQTGKQCYVWQLFSLPDCHDIK